MCSLKILLFSCRLSVVCVKMQAVNNFLGVAVTKVKKFQTIITIKVFLKSTKIGMFE